MLEPAVDRSRVAMRIELPRVPSRHRDWRTDAACVEIDSEVFFPSGKDAESREEREDRLYQERMAKRVCDTQCSVRALCARSGIEAAREYRVSGIWAGVRFTGKETGEPLARKLGQLAQIMRKEPRTWEL